MTERIVHWALESSTLCGLDFEQYPNMLGTDLVGSVTCKSCSKKLSKLEDETQGEAPSLVRENNSGGWKPVDLVTGRSSAAEETELWDNWSKAFPQANLSINSFNTSKDDPVNHPKHYTSDPSGIECIDITRHRNFNVGNAIKYLWRAGLKDSDATTQDLEKAIWYIQDEIKRLNS